MKKTTINTELTAIDMLNEVLSDLGTLEDYLSYDDFDKLPDLESECRPIYDALPWTKAIIVYIGAPEVD